MGRFNLSYEQCGTAPEAGVCSAPLPRHPAPIWPQTPNQSPFGYWIHLDIQSHRMQAPLAAPCAGAFGMAEGSLPSPARAIVRT